MPLYTEESFALVSIFHERYSYEIVFAPIKATMSLARNLTLALFISSKCGLSVSNSASYVAIVSSRLG